MLETNMLTQVLREGTKYGEEYRMSQKKYLSEISGSEMHMENLDRFGPCQIILDHFYTLGFFGPFGPFWTVLDHFGPFGTFWKQI